MSYPKWLYSSDGALLVKDESQELSLSGEWFDSPAKLKKDDPNEIVIETADEPAELVVAQEDGVQSLDSKPTAKRGRPAKDK